jgi:hypothetical protein
MTPDEARLALHRDVVFHQLDDLNALGDALAAAARDGDADHLTTVRDSLARFALAFGWQAETAVPAILAYIDKHAQFDDDLFGPAFILAAIAPAQAETVALLARLPESVCDLLSLASSAPPRP